MGIPYLSRLKTTMKVIAVKHSRVIGLLPCLEQTTVLVSFLLLCLNPGHMRSLILLVLEAHGGQQVVCLMRMSVLAESQAQQEAAHRMYLRS